MAHAVPGLLVGIGLDHLLTDSVVVRIIGEDHVRVVVDHVGGQFGELIAVDATVDELDDVLDVVVVHEVLTRLIARLQGGDLVGGHTEDEDVVFTDLLEDLDIGAVHGAEGDSTVDHELHVTGTGGLRTCQRDLLGDVGGGHEVLGHGDTVVFDVDDFDAALDVGVVVDDVGQVDDEADDLFRHVVTGSGLRAEDVGAGREVHVRVGLQHQVVVDDLIDIEVLSLVLVETFDLNVEEGVGVDDETLFLLDVSGKGLFVLAFDLAKGVEDLFVVRKLAEFAEFLSVGNEAVPDEFGDVLRELGVGLTEPASVGNAVRDVLELGRSQLIEVREDRLFEDLGVKGGNAVDAVAGGNTEVGHAHDAVRDDRHVFDLAGVMSDVPDELSVAAVDLLDDLIDAGEEQAEDVCRPALKRFFHDRVVGVSEGLGDDLPGVVPAVTALVEADPHELVL